MDSRTADLLKSLFDTQKLAVLATNLEGRSYTSLISFAASSDLKEIFFVTRRGTRKYANLLSNPEIALLIDNRSNRDSDFKEATAVTAVGAAATLAADGLPPIPDAYARKHPTLAEFAGSPDACVVCVRVRQYYIVSEFENVKVIDMEND